MTGIRKTWYFTFGYGQKHPRTGAPMDDCYTTAEGESFDEARAKVVKIFGTEWGFPYNCGEAAGVVKYELRYVPCVSYSPGELLPPTEDELKSGYWSLETYGGYRFGPEYQTTYTYEPTFYELQKMFERYNIPVTATIAHDTFSDPMHVEWDETDA